MFEYLMPLLFTQTFANSMLESACRDAVRCQIAYGAERNIPWGISECAYTALDANQIYQYRAFGVPGLGLKRGLGLARQLIDAVEAEARRRGMPGVRLGVRVVLTENQRLFGALGYVETSREPHPGFTYPTSINMRKALE